MGLPAVATLGAIPQQHEIVLGETVVVRHDMQIRNGRHDVRVRIGIVERRVARGECGGRGECRVWRAEVGDGGAAFVRGGRIGDAHVGLHEGDVFLFLGRLGGT